MHFHTQIGGGTPKRFAKIAKINFGGLVNWTKSPRIEPKVNMNFVASNYKTYVKYQLQHQKRFERLME